MGPLRAVGAGPHAGVSSLSLSAPILNYLTVPGLDRTYTANRAELNFRPSGFIRMATVVVSGSTWLISGD